MAFDFSLPFFGDSYGGNSYNTNNYTLYDDGSSSYYDNYQSDSWYTDSFSSSDQAAGEAVSYNYNNQKPEEDEGSWLDDVWDWANTEVGSNTILGGVGMLSKIWEEEWGAKLQDKYGNGNGDDGPTAAELQDARYAEHNESINQPMDMGVRKFKKA